MRNHCAVDIDKIKSGIFNYLPHLSNENKVESLRICKDCTHPCGQDNYIKSKCLDAHKMLDRYRRLSIPPVVFDNEKFNFMDDDSLEPGSVAYIGDPPKYKEEKMSLTRRVKKYIAIKIIDWFWDWSEGEYE